METKDIIYELRTKKGLSQDDLADKVFVTRQAVSRWENGDTVPNTETLKQLSTFFDVSINTLLGSPQKLVCQCCGMPLEDEIISRNRDGSFNEDYCKWCYADGTYTYSDMDDLIDTCVVHMVGDNFTEEQARAYMKEMLPTLDYWKRYEELSDDGQFEEFKQQLIREINEDYCKWCYADGTYTYSDMDDLIDTCVVHMVGDNFTEEQARAYMKEMLPTLDYWKRYEELSDDGQFEEFKQQLIREINDLHIEGMPKLEKLNALVGKYVNLEYRLPSGAHVKFLDDQKTYLGNQLESEFGGERCFGVLAGMDFILVSTYEAEGENPELVIYKKR